MSANLPSRGGRRQGPGGRDVQQARPPGADRDDAAPSGQGPGGREAVTGQPAGADRDDGHGDQDRPARSRAASARGSGARATQQAAAQRPAAQAAVRQGELGADGGDTGPTDTDRRRLRTQRALRSPRAVRQAVLLREILGPPVALRRHREDPPSLSD